MNKAELGVTIEGYTNLAILAEIVRSLDFDAFQKISPEFADAIGEQRFEAFIGGGFRAFNELGVLDDEANPTRLFQLLLKQQLLQEEAEEEEEEEAAGAVTLEALMPGIEALEKALGGKIESASVIGPDSPAYKAISQLLSSGRVEPISLH